MKNPSRAGFRSRSRRGLMSSRYSRSVPPRISSASVIVRTAFLSGIRLRVAFIRATSSSRSLAYPPAGTSTAGSPLALGLVLVVVAFLEDSAFGFTATDESSVDDDWTGAPPSGEGSAFDGVFWISTKEGPPFVSDARDFL